MALGDVLAGLEETFANIARDPLKRQVALQVGGALMQPLAPGESPAGRLGQAVAGGAELARQLQAQEAQARRAEELLRLRREALGLQKARLPLEERRVRVQERLAGVEERVGEARAALLQGQALVAEMERGVKEIEKRLLEKYGEEEAKARIERYRALAAQARAASQRTTPADVQKIRLVAGALKQWNPRLSDGEAVIGAVLITGLSGGMGRLMMDGSFLLPPEQAARMQSALESLFDFFETVVSRREEEEPAPAPAQDEESASGRFGLFEDLVRKK